MYNWIFEELKLYNHKIIETKMRLSLLWLLWCGRKGQNLVDGTVKGMTVHGGP